MSCGSGRRARPVRSEAASDLVLASSTQARRFSAVGDRGIGSGHKSAALGIVHLASYDRNVRGGHSLMATVAQDVGALKRVVKELRERLDALEGAGLPHLEQVLRQEIREARSDADVMFKVLLRQREDDRVLADRRHAEIMAQFEKLTTRPQNN